MAKSCKRLGLITDDAEIPALLNEAARNENVVLDLFLKIDCGYHRCGVEPDSQEALEIARRITDFSNLRFAGILTHAGHSYHYRSAEERLPIARHERDAMRELAARLRAAGIDVPTVSIGSTPTVTVVDHLEGNDLGLRIESLSQEHGEIVSQSVTIDRLAVGTRVRVLANHSCLSAAQHSHYNVLQRGEIVDRWEIERGW